MPRFLLGYNSILVIFYNSREKNRDVFTLLVLTFPSLQDRHWKTVHWVCSFSADILGSSMGPR